MSTAAIIGSLAAVVAAGAFVVLVVVIAQALRRMTTTLDETHKAIRELTDRALPVLDESLAVAKSANVQLDNIDTLTSAATDVTEHVSTITTLASTLIASPLMKAVAFGHGVQVALATRRARRKERS